MVLACISIISSNRLSLSPCVLGISELPVILNTRLFFLENTFDCGLRGGGLSRVVVDMVNDNPVSLGKHWVVLNVCWNRILLNHFDVIAQFLIVPQRMERTFAVVMLRMRVNLLRFDLQLSQEICFAWRCVSEECLLLSCIHQLP